MRRTLALTTLFLLAATLAACSVFTPRRGVNRTINDQNVQLTAQHALDTDPELAGKVHIGIGVYNGVLLMIGEATTEEARHRAEVVVTGYQGVQRVVNLVEVMPLQTVGGNALDASLTARVKTALLGVNLPGFDPGRVNVSTAHGNVYLMGLVSRKEADAVVKIARNVAGVNKVIQVFEYTD